MLRPLRTALLGVLCAIVVLSGLALVPGAPNPLRVVEEPFAGVLDDLLPSFQQAFPGSVDLGLLPSTPLTVGVALAPQDPAESSLLIQEMYTPGTPYYHHFLSAEQYETLFSPTTAQVQAVVNYYASYGINAQPSADRLMVSLAGPSDAIGVAFGTTFHRFQLSDGELTYGPSSGAKVPAGLDISALTSFSGTTGLQPFFHGSPVVPTPASPAACSPVSGNSPSELQGQYGETPILSAYNGSGMKVGIVDAYDSAFTQSDATSTLTSFSSGCSLPKPSINYLYPTRTTANLNSTTSSGWGGETELDIETVHSMAPGATIDLTLAADSSLDVYEAVDYLVAFNVTNTISMSWGENDLGTGHEAPQNPCLPYYSCNASWDGSYGFLHPVFAEAVAEGISPFGAAGDCGAYDSTSILTTDYPGSDEYVTDVGGTVLNSSGTTYGGESGWSGTGKDCTANEGGGGGGFAPWPRPFWQSGEGLTNYANGQRGAPDVSASSADGTSEATPIWAGLTAVGDQMHGGGMGLLGPSLYAILRNPTEYAADFHDIVVGNNGYPAGRGWDPITGIGSPDIQNLLPDLFRYQPPSVGGMTVTLSASPGNTAAETFTAKVTGGTAPYDYDFVPGLYLGHWAGSSSSIPYTYAADGAYFATVEVWDANGNWTQSLPVLVQVTGTALSATLTPSTTSTTVGTAVAFTAGATGGTSPYSYDYIWGDGSYGYNATSSDVHTYQAPGTYCPSVEVTDSATPADGGLGTSSCITVTAGSGPSPLSARISAAPMSGAPWLHVNFSSITSGGTGGNTYLWSFGDGSAASTSADPYYVYDKVGRFQVNLTVTDSATVSAYAFTNITVATSITPLSATISPLAPSGQVPYTVAFASSVSGGIGPYAYSWTYGDQTPISGAADPTHTYNASGTFEVRLVVTDQEPASKTLFTNVTVNPMTAQAQASATSGAAPFSVVFKGTETGGVGPYQWSWSFGDGAASAAQDPTHVYNASGTYTVGLKVTDSAGRAATASSLAISVAAETISASVAGPSGSVAVGGAADFSAAASGGIGGYTYAWSESPSSGLGCPSSDASALDCTPTAVGNYQVSVVATDHNGVASGSAEASATVVAAGSQLTVEVGGTSSVPVAQSATFWAAASGGSGGDSFTFSFGDQTSSGASSSNTTTHAYSAAGSYTVTVTVTDSAGASATSSGHTVTVTTPSSSSSTSSPSNPFLSNGTLTTLGWLLVALVAVALVAGVAFSLRRRSKGPEMPPLTPYEPVQGAPPGYGGWASAPPSNEPPPPWPPPES